MKKLFSLLTIFFSITQVFALGEWTDYSSYSSASKVVLANDLVYCVTTGGLFTYDTTDNSLQTVSSINGLSDVGIETAEYGEEADVLIIAYENSNLDLIYGNDIYNISAIKQKQIPADKTINNILFVGQTAYLSCGFGIVAINLEKREIKETYYIGSNGSYLTVYDMAFDGQYLYAATENGIYKADINSPNLQDYNYWERDETIPNFDSEFNQIELFNDEIITNYNSSGGNDELYSYSNGNWQNILPSFTDDVCEINASSDYLVITCDNEIDIYDSTFSKIAEISGYNLSYNVSTIYPTSTVLASNGIIWVADSKYALVKISGSQYEKLVPQGPADNNVFALTANENDLWVASGGRTSAWNNIYTNAQFQLFRNDKWTVFNGETESGMGDYHDIVCITVDPDDPDHVFAGSWGGGIFEFQDNELTEHYDNFNSSLQTALPESPEEHYVRISDMDYDSEGNLWVTNSIVGEPLSVLSKDGSWKSFSLDGVNSDTNVGQMVITEEDDQWIILPRGNNLVVRKADGSNEMTLELIAYFTNGSEQSYTQMNDIYSIALDNEGAIWFGTSEGVGVIYNPGNVWEQDTFYASQPGLDEDDDIYHPLLSSETVTAIAVDGANRKWFGTKNSGVYLISDDGEEEIQHFTSDNSPLLSDEITSIAINDNTGEVFFGTSKGLISYGGNATTGEIAYTDVYAYPNPVREDYNGDIAICGLIENTNVKITDISGNLVYETTSLGGQATWDGTNMNGNRVSTGVYIVFGNNPSGEQTFTTKILFIH